MVIGGMALMPEYSIPVVTTVTRATSTMVSAQSWLCSLTLNIPSSLVPLLRGELEGIELSCQTANYNKENGVRKHAIFNKFFNINCIRSIEKKF